MTRFTSDQSRVLDRYGPLWLSVDQACAKMASLMQLGAHASGDVRRMTFDEADDLRLAIIEASAPARPFLSVVADVTNTMENAA